MKRPARIILAISMVMLIIIGHFAAIALSDIEYGGIIIALSYAVWLIISSLVFLDKNEIIGMFGKASRPTWTLLPASLALPVFIFVFVPNIGIIQPDAFLFFHIMVCLFNPFIEEIYWRGLISKLSDKPINAFLISSFAFAAGHPLIFGVNSYGISGWLGFAGSLIAGAAFWIAYYKMKSIRGVIFAHFLIDVAGMAGYILANKARLVM